MCANDRHLWEALGIAATLIGEGGVVFAILYESRSSRLADFFSEAHADRYTGRGNLYSAYADLEAATLSDRAARFQQLLASNSELRAEADRQVAFFARFQFTLRSSIFFWQRGLLSRLYPHVLVRLWIMLHKRIQESVPHGEWERLFLVAVNDSFEALAKQPGDTRVERIRSLDRSREVIVTSEDLSAAHALAKTSLSR